MNDMTPAILQVEDTPYYVQVIQRADLAPGTKRNYIRELTNLLTSGVNIRDYQAVIHYTQGLPYSGRTSLKSAIRLITADARTDLKLSATAENLAQTMAALLNLEGMTEIIHTKAPQGEATHIWLSRDQVEKITALPDRSTTRGMRDYIILAGLLGTGLRVNELHNARFEDLKQQPARGRMRDVLAVPQGKGNKKRTIPISPLLAKHIRTWQTIAGGEYIARSFNKAEKIGERLSTQGISDIVAHYGALIDVPELECHDCRRTYAELGLAAGIPITQISKLLGHANIAITQRYLNLEIDLESTISDVIPISGD